MSYILKCDVCIAKMYIDPYTRCERYDLAFEMDEFTKSGFLNCIKEKSNEAYELIKDIWWLVSFRKMNPIRGNVWYSARIPSEEFNLSWLRYEIQEKRSY